MPHALWNLDIPPSGGSVVCIDAPVDAVDYRGICIYDRGSNVHSITAEDVSFADFQ